VARAKALHYSRPTIGDVDHGVGLPVEGADRIFEAFFTTKPDGTGIGLPLSRRIVEQHGGRLWASPNTPRGAVFHFTVPLTPGATSDRYAAANVSAAPSRGAPARVRNRAITPPSRLASSFYARVHLIKPADGG
jgi:hypothetical protein